VAGDLGVLGVWTDDRPHIRISWARARECPNFRRGLYDLMTLAELTQMQAHWAKSAKVAALLAGLRGVGPAFAQ